MRKQFADGADIDSFQHMPFILIKRGNRTRNTVDQYFSRHFFKPKLILETENTVTALAMAEAGGGHHHLSGAVCQDHPRHRRPLLHRQAGLLPSHRPLYHQPSGVGYRRDRYLSHFGERFIQLTQQALQG